MHKERTAWNSEDDFLARQVQLHGCEWAAVSYKLCTTFGIKRSAKQCRERFVNHVDASLVKRPFSNEEDKVIFDKHEALGNKWKKIAAFLPGRSDNSVKNQFYSMLRKGLRWIARLVDYQVAPSELKVLKPKIISTLLHSSTIANIPHFQVFKELVKRVSLTGEYPQQVMPPFNKEDFKCLVSLLTLLNGQHLKRKEDKLNRTQDRTKRRYNKKTKHEFRVSGDQLSSQLLAQSTQLPTKINSLEPDLFCFEATPDEEWLEPVLSPAQRVEVQPFIEPKQQPITEFPQIFL